MGNTLWDRLEIVLKMILVPTLVTWFAEKRGLGSRFEVDYNNTNKYLLDANDMVASFPFIMMVNDQMLNAFFNKTTPFLGVNVLHRIFGYFQRKLRPTSIFLFFGERSANTVQFENSG